jgi:UDP-glucose/iron transport system permease protein
METSYLQLMYWQVGLAALLIAINAAISIALRLGLERSLAIGSVRTIVQLLLIGLVLEWVFRVDRWYVVLGFMAVMTVVAAVTAVGRNSRRYSGIWIDTILSIWASSWLVTGYGVLVVTRGVESWYHPQYTIPLLGMVLGNTLNGISVGLGTFTESLVTRRAEVETFLALGATRWEAGQSILRHALRTGLTPIINSMMVVGIVSLPGMMTGQLLSGVAPIQAVKYQIVIMFLIASATALGATCVMLLSFRRLFNADHQFLAGQLATERPNRNA